MIVSESCVSGLLGFAAGGRLPALAVGRSPDS